jgi:hypothetical protein
MTDDYSPPSDFLQACVNEEVPLTGSLFADANLARLIAMTRDEDVANRDWATLLLAQTELDTPEIQAAFRERLGDADAIVRGEALSGLAMRDRAGTLPLVANELDGIPVGLPTMEAAELIADATLLPHLLPWLAKRCNPSDEFDLALEEAVRACGGDPAAYSERSTNRRGPGQPDKYLPESPFLIAVSNGDVEFVDHPRADFNLRELLGFVRDQDRANRDWAAFLIAQLPLDTTEIRAALVHASADEDGDVRDEALVGLARRNRAAALERIVPELEESVSPALLEAAAIIADPSLLPLLSAPEGWGSGDEDRFERLRKAIAACEAGVWTYMGEA